MRVPLRLPAIVALTLHSGLAAQHAPAAVRGRWAIGISVGTSAYSGATGGPGPTGEQLSFTPYRPTMLGLVVSHGGAGFRMALMARYGEPALAVRGFPVTDEGEVTPGVMLVAENAYHLGSLTLAASNRLLRLRGGPELRPSFGVSLERWSAPGSPVRTIAGGQAGVAAEVVLTGAFVVTIEGELGFTPSSPFRRQDLPEGFTPRGTWRRSLAAALYWRF